MWNLVFGINVEPLCGGFELCSGYEMPTPYWYLGCILWGFLGARSGIVLWFVSSILKGSCCGRLHCAEMII